MLPAYSPEPYVNFAEPGPAETMRSALNDVRARLGRSYPLHINGEAIETTDTIKSIMPASNATVVGFVSKANAEQAEKAIITAAEQFRVWSCYPADARAKILIKAAAIMRRRLYELSAWQCFEVSKGWIEAYADVCEAIDFLEFYGREMLRLGGRNRSLRSPAKTTNTATYPWAWLS
jgi:1-pyrroline-5-carboxylate dehydrogenase